MIRGEYILGTGILADMITTVIGVSQGLEEGNMMGLTHVLIANFILLYIMIFTVQKNRHKLIDYIFIILGLFRIGITIWNLKLIV
jgi:hypothetical protein